MVAKGNDSKTNEYTYKDIREHRTTASAWVGIHGNVYDITDFIPRHPGGNLILTSLGRDGTTLFETHHNMLSSSQMEKVKSTMAKYKIGIVKDYKPLAKFDSPFALELLRRVREHIKDQPHRDSFTVYVAVVFIYVAISLLVIAELYYGNLWIALPLGFIMSMGHSCGHSGNHGALSSNDTFNRFVSMTCTNLWGLREKYWEFSHLISHHCYNYTDRDYILEQHLPLEYFRVRESDPWKPIHAYQHLLYLATPFTAFVVGAMRLDCAPWIFVSPLLGFLRHNKESHLPAPQFFAAGSNAAYEDLKEDEDGVGPERYVLFESAWDNFVSVFLANLIWLPLFIYNVMHRGFLHALLFNSICFGLQAGFVTKGLLTQHMCEGIKLDRDYEPDSCWYRKQIEASTTLGLPFFFMLVAFALSNQTEHHIFPCMSPTLLYSVAKVVGEVAREHNVQYNYFSGQLTATMSVYKQFQIMGKKPAHGKTL